MLSLLKKLALSSPGIRQVVALDSNVGLSALAKGRSPSYGLRPCIRKTGATIVAGRLYPAYHFAPGIMTAPLLWLQPGLPHLDLRSSWILLRSPCFPGRRQTGFDLLCCCGVLSFLGLVLKKGGGIQAMCSSIILSRSWLPCNSIEPLLWILTPPLDFQVRGLLGFYALDFSCKVPLDFASGFLSPACGGPVGVWYGLPSGVPGVRVRCLRFSVGVLLYVPVVSCVSHGPVLTPRNPGDMPEGSRVLGQTQLQRDRLLNEFGRWLKEDDLSLEALIGMAEVDIEF